MKVECPHILESAPQLLKHLLRADIQCAQATGMFTVMSCPVWIRPDNNSTEEDTPLAEANTRNGSDDKPTRYPETSTISSPDSSEGVVRNSFISLVVGAPVSDLHTGLVYIDRSVALCNRALESDLSPWKVIARLTKTVEPRSLTEVDNFLDTERYFYRSPDIPAHTPAGSPCIRDAISKCKPGWLVDRPDLEAKCLNGSITFYKATDRYKNIHCFACNVGTHEGATPVMHYTKPVRLHGLSVVAAFTTDGRLRVSVRRDQISVKWDTVACSMDMTERADEQCVSSGESDRSPESRRLWENSCPYVRKISFGVTIGHCTLVRSERIERELLSLIKCYMETIDEAVFHSKHALFQTVYAPKLGLPLLEMTVDACFPRFRIAQYRTQVWREVAMLVYDTDFCCEPVRAEAVCSGESCRVDDLDLRAVETLDAPLGADWNTSMTEDKHEGRWVVVCESNVVINNLEYSVVTCQKHDMRTLNLDPFHMTANVTCFGNQVGKSVLQTRE